MNFRDFIPPIVAKLSSKIRRKDTVKEYQTYAMAILDCTRDAYENAEVCSMIADKTIAYKHTIQADDFQLSPTNIFLIAAIQQLNIERPNTPLKILDFGGACGTHYFEVRKFLSENIVLNWIVVETEQMVKLAIDKNLSNKELNFVHSTDHIASEIDMIHSSCALHYVPEPYPELHKLLSLKSKTILFNRMMFNEGPREFVTVQRSLMSANGPGKMPSGYTDREISYPHTTLSFEKFNSTILDHGYHAEWQFRESTGYFPINNEKIIGQGILYKLKT